jgi:hypothetical protein
LEGLPAGAKAPSSKREAFAARLKSCPFKTGFPPLGFVLSQVRESGSFDKLRTGSGAPGPDTVPSISGCAFRAGGGSGDDDFAHGGEIVDAEDGHDFEFAVELLVHLAVFPDDERGHGFGALDVGDVEALDAAGQLGEHEGVGERFLNGLAAGLEDAEALDVGLLGVLAGEVDEGALFSALRDGDFDAMAGALGEQGGERFAVVEVDGDEDGAGDVVLVDVELLEEGEKTGPAWNGCSGVLGGGKKPPVLRALHPQRRRPFAGGPGSLRSKG